MEKYKNSKPLFYKSALKFSAIHKGLLLIAVLTIVFGENLKAKIDQTSKSNADDYSSQGIAGISSLMNAVNNEDVEGVKFFVSAGDNLVNQKNIGGATALHIAARSGNVEIFNTLINNGADVNDTDNEGWTALMRASSFKHPEIVAILVSKNAEIGKLNSFKESAIIHSASSECLECLGILINNFNYNSIDLNTLKNQINEASYIAKKKDNLSMQQLLTSFLERVSKNNSSSNKFVKNDNGVLEKIYNFMGKTVESPKLVENPKNDKATESKYSSNKSLPAVIQNNEPNQSLIPNKKLDKKGAAYLFLGNKFSKNYKFPQTPYPTTLEIKKELESESNNTKTEVSEKKLITPIPSDSVLKDKKPMSSYKDEVIYNLGGEDKIRDKSIESELPDNKLKNDSISSGEKKYNFLGKKHIAYKIKPFIKKKDSATPVISNQNISPANNNPAISNPSAPVKNEDKKSKETLSSNSVQPANVAPKVESSNDSAPAINASAKSSTPPPPPIKKNPSAPSAPSATYPKSEVKDEYTIPSLPDTDKF